MLLATTSPAIACRVVQKLVLYVDDLKKKGIWGEISGITQAKIVQLTNISRTFQTHFLAEDLTKIRTLNFFMNLSLFK